MLEILKELLVYILYLGIITVVPLVTSKLIQYLSLHIENERIQKMIKDIASSVNESVIYVTQTYVDSLKNSGDFTKESQEKALNMAYETATKYITKDSKQLFESLYGDLDEYLKVVIEAEVKKLKVQDINNPTLTQSIEQNLSSMNGSR